MNDCFQKNGNSWLGFKGQSLHVIERHMKLGHEI